MFNNYAMYDYEIIESAEEICSGKLVLSLDDLHFLLDNVVREAMNKKAEDRLVFGVFQAMLSSADQDDDSEMLNVFDAVVLILRNMEDPEKALDMTAESGISFTETRYCQGELTCLRDYILKWVFNVKIVDRLFRLGVDLNAPLVAGKTTAWIAADRDYILKKPWMDTDIEEELARAVRYFSRESMETPDKNGFSAVHMAAKRNHARMLQAMADAGVNMNVTTDSRKDPGSTALHLACLQGYSNIVELLISVGADDTILNVQEESPAHTVLFHDYITGSKRLTQDERIALAKALKHVDVPGKDGRTPLIAALSDDNYGIRCALAPVFVEKGADVNHRDNFGNTPLLLAEGTDIVKVLVKAGADVNARDDKGDTPLHHALQRMAGQEARYLIKKGANIRAENAEGVTPLQLAVEKGVEDVLPLMGITV